MRYLALYVSFAHVRPKTARQHASGDGMSARNTTKEGQDAAPIPTDQQPPASESPFRYPRDAGGRRWMAYAGAAWADSFMRQALTRSQMIHAIPNNPIIVLFEKKGKEKSEREV